MLDLLPMLVTLIHNATDVVPTCLKILESYLLLDAVTLLRVSFATSSSSLDRELTLSSFFSAERCRPPRRFRSQSERPETRSRQGHAARAEHNLPHICHRQLGSRARQLTDICQTAGTRLAFRHFCAGHDEVYVLRYVAYDSTLTPAFAQILLLSPASFWPDRTPSYTSWKPPLHG